MRIRFNFKKCFLSQSGFTLIEVLVVLTITIMLSAFLIVYGSGSRQQISLSVEAAKITQVIMRAKSLAVSTFNSPVLPCGYGVHFDYSTGAYNIFQYQETSTSCAGLNPGFLMSSFPPRQIIQQFQVDPNVRLIAGSKQVEDILFIPPNPRVIIWDGGSYLAASDDGLIRIGAKTGTGEIDVRVDVAGQVTF